MPEFRRHDYFELRVERHIQLLRGRIAHWRGAHVGARFGLGRGVRILYPSCFQAGDDVLIGDYSFLHCLCAKGVRFGAHTSTSSNLWLSCGRNLESPGYFEIGEYSFIGPNGVMGAGGGILIGNHVQLGPGVTIVAENHCYADTDQRIDEQGVKHEGVIIEDDCWLGGRVTVLDGVTIGRGSVIGAGAVVTKDIPSLSVAIGVPARVVKKRG